MDWAANRYLLQGSAVVGSVLPVPQPPEVGYVAEDDVTYYVAEDGVTFYIAE